MASRAAVATAELSAELSAPLSAGLAGALPAREPTDVVGTWEQRLRLWSEADESSEVLEQLEVVDWDDLMRRHGRRVVLSLIARGVRPERAKELAQDAWLRVIQAHRTGRLPELRVPGVVLAQANFLLLDERRRHERRAPHLVNGEGEALGLGDGIDEAGLERRLAARDELRKILAVVERAHPSARRVFALAYGGPAMSAAEIASELGLSVQRVRQITCELRKRIREAVGRGGDRDG